MVAEEKVFSVAPEGQRESKCQDLLKRARFLTDCRFVTDPSRTALSDPSVRGDVRETVADGNTVRRRLVQHEREEERFEAR